MNCKCGGQSVQGKVVGRSDRRNRMQREEEESSPTKCPGPTVDFDASSLPDPKPGCPTLEWLIDKQVDTSMGLAGCACHAVASTCTFGLCLDCVC